MRIPHEVPFPDAGLVIFGVDGIDLFDDFNRIAGRRIDDPLHLLLRLGRRRTVDGGKLRVTTGQDGRADSSDGEK